MDRVAVIHFLEVLIPFELDPGGFPSWVLLILVLVFPMFPGERFGDSLKYRHLVLLLIVSRGLHLLLLFGVVFHRNGLFVGALGTGGGFFFVVVHGGFDWIEIRKKSVARVLLFLFGVVF